jgi:predicted RNA-binding Zn ribbon-like protein
MTQRRQPQRRTDRRSAAAKRDGALALTFVNTTAAQRTPLDDYAGLLAWSRKHGALSSEEAGRLERLAAERSDEADAAFDAAEDLRDLLARIMNALADGERPTGEAIDALSAYFVHTVPPPRLVPAGDGYRRDWAAAREDDLSRPLWLVVQSAFDVLTSEERGCVVRCAGEGCGLLFVARNQGRPRKWCDMKACGNRAKSRRRYHGFVKHRKKEIRRRAKERLRREGVERARARREQADRT